MVIKRIDPISAAKVSGLLGALLGLVIGAFMSLFFMVAGSVASTASPRAGSAFIGMLFGAGAIVIFPIFYGVLSFVMGAIQAALYNVASKWTGGVQIDVA